MDLIAKAVTLKSIKLNDPSANKLLFSAKHAVLYDFDASQSNWEKTETEGCLAIYKRVKAAGTRNSSTSVLFILNRLRPENFSCPLAEIQSVQLEGDLLMLLLNNSQVMGIWLFDEKERQLALNVLESLLNNSEESEIEDEQSGSAHHTQTQLKPILVTDLLGTTGKKEKTPSILDLLAKAKIKDEASSNSAGNTAVTNVAQTLESAITERFKDLPPSTSLKSFTNSVCQFIQSNPQLLTSLHRDLSKQ